MIGSLRGYIRVRASADFIRLFIRGIKWDADDASSTFEATLKAASRAQLKETTRGKVLAGTTSAGTSVQYMLPPMGDLTAADLAQACSYLHDLIDAIKAGNPSITDAALYAAVLAEVSPVSASRPDFSGGFTS